MVLLALVSVPSDSSAQVLSTRVEVQSCAEIDASEAQKLIGIELSAAQVSAPDDGTQTHVLATCSPAQVQVDVRDPAVGFLTRTLSWHAVAGSGRTRLVALAVAEMLIVAHRDRAASEAATAAPIVEGAVDSASVKLPAPTASPATAVSSAQAAPATPPMLYVQVGARKLSESWPLGLSVATGIVLPWRDTTAFAWVLELDGFTAARDVVAGSVWLQSLALAPALRWRSAPRTLQVHLDLGLDLAAAMFSGQSDDDRVAQRTAFTTWAGPRGSAAGHVSVGSWALGVGVKAGYNARPLQAEVVSGSKRVDTAPFSGWWQSVFLLAAHAL